MDNEREKSTGNRIRAQASSPQKILAFFMGNSKMKAPSKKAVTQIVRGPHAAFPQTAKHCLHVVVWIKTLLSCLFPLLS